ncbi:hypothetical protein ACFQHW_00220 [Lapidilactobacillus achengensis]|uniref:ECF transporter S component n=1 Tax=Lapidilactobacillus achengensis TaxID=2486000 RepID=A0ABW1UK20_9LACO|nr:hypothetical protein [Lapidilactobacillus achengensis]
MVNLPAKRIAFLAMMAALAVILGLITSPLPNFSFTVAFYLLLIDFAGFSSGWLVMLVAVLASNLRTGVGPWTLFQLLAYTLIFLLWWGALHLDWLDKRWAQTFVAALLAFSFGFWNALLNVPFYHLPHFWVYYAQGLAFDGALCLATAIGYWLMNRYLLPLLQRRVPELARRHRGQD